MCDHDWKPTGMFLMTWANTYGTNSRSVSGIVGREVAQGPNVEMCSRCGLFRAPAAALAMISEQTGGLRP